MILDRVLVWRIAIGWGFGVFVGACLGTVLEMTGPNTRPSWWFVLGAILGFVGLMVYIVSVASVSQGADE